jgi:hypothetical protein
MSLLKARGLSTRLFLMAELELQIQLLSGQHRLRKEAGVGPLLVRLGLPL